jgi:hypothetical protein
MRKPRADLEQELEKYRHELAEAREQQAATSEVLRVISSSPGDLKPVFETMLANATRLCQARFGNLFLREGDGFRIVAMHGAPTSTYAESYRREPVIDLHEHPHVPLARIIETKAGRYRNASRRPRASNSLFASGSARLRMTSPERAFMSFQLTAAGVAPLREFPRAWSPNKPKILGTSKFV